MNRESKPFSASLHDNIWLPVKVFIPEKMLQIKQNM
jgi:hypothetical protein